MRRILSLVLVVPVLLATAVARGDGGTFAASAAYALPSAAQPNGSDLSLPENWLTPPPVPVQLSQEELLGLWQSAGQAYGVPWNVLGAINKIESNFGRNMGPSSAGAIGWMQFMPSTWLRWGTDANADGLADPWNPVDAVYSAARYLAASGAATDIRRAIFAYNHADWYVNDVLALAQLYAGSGPGTALDVASPALAQVEARIQAAQSEVAKASEAYRDATSVARALAARAQEATARAGSLSLLSDELDAQKDAARVGADAYAAQLEADRLRRELEAARAALAALEEQAQAAASGQPAAQTGVYVFPVGGGAQAVTVSHGHHDYPAADIAAPEGSPLYALADGTVLYAWNADARCGTGFTFQAADGRTWTYCHLSYLSPLVAPGAQLRAGDPVGLVGATGHATGPHLHLQLQPATSYPQDEQWFQSFAGTAFRWSDDAGAARDGPAGPPVFHVVGPAE